MRRHEVLTVTILSDGDRSTRLRGRLDRHPPRSQPHPVGDAWCCSTATRPTGTFALSDAAMFEPGKAVEIKVRYESETQDATLFKGAVVRHGVEADAHGSVLRVELKDAAVKLAQARKSRRLSRSDRRRRHPQAGRRSAGLTVGQASTPRSRNTASSSSTNCSDWDFILSRADCPGAARGRRGRQDLGAKGRASAGAAKASFEYGSATIYDLRVRSGRRHQYPTVKSRGWSIKDQQERVESSSAKAFAVSQGNLDGKSARRRRSASVPTRCLTPSRSRPRSCKPGPTPACSAAACRCCADGWRRRADPTSRCWISSTIDGDRRSLQRQGARSPASAIASTPAAGGRTSSSGLSPRSFSSGGRHPRCARRRAAARRVSGLHVGVVAEFAEDPDKQLRVKVTLPRHRIGDRTLVWARLAAPDAGKDRGFFFRPETGDEVVIGFFNDDPRQPVILGSLHSSKNAPAGSLRQPDEEQPEQGHRHQGRHEASPSPTTSKASVLVETAGKNRILLDDDRERDRDLPTSTATRSRWTRTASRSRAPRT